MDSPVTAIVTMVFVTLSKSQYFWILICTQCHFTASIYIMCITICIYIHKYKYIHILHKTKSISDVPNFYKKI
jgi:hypothetical protein